MRKIVQSTLISLDGVVDDPGSWAMRYFNQESAEEAHAQLDRSDGMLMGRNSYRDLAARWRSETGAFAERMRQIAKHVFSSTIDPDATDWANATVHAASPLDVITRLRSEGDGDLTIYGHTRLGRTLLEAGLVDEWIFSVHPVLVGRPEGRIASMTRSMELIESRQRQSGVVVLRYRCA